MKILAIDIETRPNLAYVWGLWDQNVGLNQLVESAEVICFAAKWLGSGRVTYRSVYHDGKAAMLDEAHRLLSEADAVVHWHGARFDIPHLNREFLQAGYDPPPPLAQIDLYKVVRKHFRFPSYKLDYISKELGIEGKAETGGFQLWLDCMREDRKAWSKMRKYNIQDVIMLEDMYNRLLPWITNHPNQNLHGEDGGCPTCGSGRLQRRGLARTKTAVYQRYQCLACGAWSRAVKRSDHTEVTL